MKLFLILITFFAFTVNAQESKPKFFQQLYLEPNVAFGLFNSVKNDFYEMHDHYWVITSSLGFNYRNSFFKTGIDFNYFFTQSLFSLRYQTSFNLHKLLSDKPSESFFCGPIIGVGYYDHTKYLGFPYFTIGLDNYFYNFHFALKFDVLKTRDHYSYMKKANMIYLEVGYAIHLGKKKKTQE